MSQSLDEKLVLHLIILVAVADTQTMASHKQQQQAAPLQSSSSHDDLPKALELEFDAETGQISLTLFEHTDDKGAVPLTLLYKFSPETPYAPIHQVETPEVNKAVKQHCE